MNPVSIPVQSRGIDGSTYKHREYVIECLDLFEALGLARSHVDLGHHELMLLPANRLGTNLTETLVSLRPIELRALRARLTGHVVRAGSV
jgi:hypothetical protein